MNVALWVAAIVLAATFLLSGSLKLVMSKERLIATRQTGVKPFPLPAIRVIAACELLGVLGIVLPWATGIVPVLTPLAAVGMVGLMIGAAISHGSLGEYRQSALNVTLLAIAAFVAVGRFAAL
jgi:uncharacterized membrane protein YphA (DoxX/SURF4 family)